MIQRFVVLHASSSTLFLHLGLSATHHHPDIWHASDVVRDGKSLGTAEKSLDYGIFQLIAVGHRPEVDASLWMSSVTFGRHGLHHMFPTLDLCVLSHLKEILWQTCKDFHVEDIATVDVKTAEGEQRRTAWGKKRAISTWNSWWGMIRQCFRAHANANNFPSHLFVKKGN